MPSGYNIQQNYPSYQYTSTYERVGYVGQTPNVQTVFLGYDVVTNVVTNPGIDTVKYRAVTMAGPTPGYRNLAPYQRPANPGSDDVQETVTSKELTQLFVYGYGGTFKREELFRLGSFSAAQIFTDPDPTSHFGVQAKFFEKVNNIDVNLAVAFAEKRKTAEMISDRVKKFARSLKDLRRGRLASAMSHLGVGVRSSLQRKLNELRPYQKVVTKANGRSKTVTRTRRKYVKQQTMRLDDRELSSLWLEAMYGWLPLASDVEGAAIALAKSQVDPTRTDWTYTRARGRCTKTYISVSSDAIPVTTRAIVTKQITYGSWIRYTRACPEAIHQLGLTSLAEVVWELTPWSFVFDWFANVNDMITASTALSGYEFVNSFASNLMTSECIATRQTVNTPNYPEYSVVTLLRAPTWKRRRFNRFTWTPSAPPFRFRSDPLNLRRTSNAIALAVQSVRRL